MINAAQAIIDNGICSLKLLFESSFLGVTYNAGNAKRRLLQMLLAALLPKINKESPKVYVMELIPRVDYEKLVNIFESATKATSSQALSKSELQNFLTLAQSDRERELVKYTAFKTSGLTASAARRRYGFDNMSKRAARVEACIEECLHIHESINSLSEDQEAAAMQLLGINDSGTDGSSKMDSSGEQDDSLLQNTPETNYFDYDEVGPILRESQFNWFESQYNGRESWFRL